MYFPEKKVELIQELISDFKNIKKPIELENFKNKSMMVINKICKDSNNWISKLDEYLKKYTILIDVFSFDGPIVITFDVKNDIKNGITKQKIINLLELLIKEIEIDKEHVLKNNKTFKKGPIIKEFQISPTICKNGDTVTLYWEVENANSPIIISNRHRSGGGGEYNFGNKMKGHHSFTINAAEDVEYILTVKNDFGEIEKKILLRIDSEIANRMKVIKILLSSPSDVSRERKLVQQIEKDLNSSLSDRTKTILRVIYWEQDARPGIGNDGQDVINKTLPIDYNIYLGIMGGKFGTPTGRANSGTEEEFNQALNKYKNGQDIEILFYFKKHRAKTPMNSELKKIEDFKKRLQNEGILYFQYSNQKDLHSQIYKHLSGFFFKKEKV
ncbi:MAG: hypothetical protein JW833_07250 [Prolixibacteraceae bacterium]|nr:hypothetical protein [Prolixibacteraceae bacterium]